MKKIAIYLILLIATSAVSTTIFGQGYGHNSCQNDHVYNDPYYQSHNASYPNKGGYGKGQYPVSVEVNSRPIMVNPYAVLACAPPVASCRPVVLHPYPVYPVMRHGNMAHFSRRSFHHGRGWR